MTAKTLIITPQGTAKEINKYGKEKPLFYQTPIQFVFQDEVRQWQTIEDSLKEYKIVNEYYCGSSEIVYIDGRSTKKIITGSIHQCEVNEVDKTAVVL